MGAERGVAEAGNLLQTACTRVRLLKFRRQLGFERCKVHSDDPRTRFRSRRDGSDRREFPWVRHTYLASEPVGCMVQAYWGIPSLSVIATVGPPSKTKRLALFLDGTTDKSEGNTNVWRARSLCAARDKDDREQRIYYAAGVGTQLGVASPDVV